MDFENGTEDGSAGYYSDSARSNNIGLLRESLSVHFYCLIEGKMSLEKADSAKISKNRPESM